MWHHAWSLYLGLLAQDRLTLVRIMYCTLQYINSSHWLTSHVSATELLAQITQEVSLLTVYVLG